MSDDYEPYEWQVGDPSDWGDSVGVPDIPYMGYINNGDDDEDERPPHRPPMSADRTLAKQAMELEDQGRHGEAMALIDRALEINPNHYNHWNIKAIILDNWGRNEEALKYYDKSLSLNDSQVVRANKSQCLYRIADRGSALKSTEKDLKTINEALAILPDDIGRKDYLRTKGRILNNLGRKVQAKKCFLLAAGMHGEIEKLERRVKIIESSKVPLINITGTRFYNARVKLKENTVVDLIKEPNNEHDHDAIRVEIDGETAGYVANSSWTLTDGIASATDIKDKFKDRAKAKVMFRYLDEFLIAKLID